MAPNIEIQSMKGPRLPSALSGSHVLYAGVLKDTVYKIVKGSRTGSDHRTPLVSRFRSPACSPVQLRALGARHKGRMS